MAKKKPATPARARRASPVYKASAHARYTDAEAAWIGQQIEQSGGQIKPKELVDLARPARSPIHHLFEWDDTKAAEAYRVEQARGHLRVLEIEIIYEGEPTQMRACLPVFIDHGEDAAPERAHVTSSRIASSPDLSRQIVENAATEVKRWRRRYERYKKVFGPVFHEIDKLKV